MSVPAIPDSAISAREEIRKRNGSPIRPGFAPRAIRTKVKYFGARPNKSMAAPGLSPRAVSNKYAPIERLISVYALALILASGPRPDRRPRPK